MKGYTLLCGAAVVASAYVYKALRNGNSPLSTNLKSCARKVSSSLDKFANSSPSLSERHEKEEGSLKNKASIV
jgi:hypothetical protein